MRGPRRGPGSTTAAPAPAGPKLYGLAELQAMLNYPSTNKARLRAKLPPPDVELRMGPIWYASTINHWLQTTRLADVESA